MRLSAPHTHCLYPRVLVALWRLVALLEAAFGKM